LIGEQNWPKKADESHKSQEITHLGQEHSVTLEDEGSVFLPNVRNQ